MQVVVLSARVGWHTDELCRALVDRGHSSVVLPYEGLVAHLGRSGASSRMSEAASSSTRPSADPRARAPLAADEAGSLSIAQTSLFDAGAVLARIIPGGSLEQIIYRVDALHWLERRGVVVLNSPRTIERCVDKFYTDALLREAGLPTPETVVCERADEAMIAVSSMRDVVIKPLFGSMGHGLVRVSDPDVAYRVARSLEQIKAVFYVQRAIDHGGRDLRVFVVGGRVLGAIERQAPDGQWRSNVSRGATARPIGLSREWEDLALRAANEVGADYAGVDLLPAPDGGVYVLEVNGIPGWQGLQRATGVDVAGAIVDHLVLRASGRTASAEQPA
jgi:RimK family alpha-L-glutamate ligase